MSAEPIAPLRPARRARVSHGERLRAALLNLAGGHAAIVRHSERAWASITFSGTRHSLHLVFDGNESVETGENFIAALPDHEFTIAGQLVAEATIASVEHAILPHPRMEVECELLLLIDG